MACTLVWFRRHLRIVDHDPLYRAAQRGSVVPVFVLDRSLLHHPETGVARVAFMLQCLAALNQELNTRGGRLIIRTGDPSTVLPRLIQEANAEGIYAYLDCERLYGRVRDAQLNRVLIEQSMRIRWFEPPGLTPDLIPYPQYRDLWFQQMENPLTPTPRALTVPDEIPGDPIPSSAELGLAEDGKRIPVGGTEAARGLLQAFLDEKTERYYWQLSYPGAAVTSGLSPYLKFGVISTRDCYHMTQRALKSAEDPRVQRSCQQFIARLRWGSGFTQRFRYLPQLELRSLYTVFDAEGWTFDENLYQAWQEGYTGFPIIDAAARCLQTTGGWQQLNFRVRAIYASFLTNLLGMDWRYGALHFMRHLIDGDCPIDHYQWAMQAGVTHCVDKTWTRIYNPQQVAIDRCDPDGSFIRQWVPEVAHLPSDQIGEPPVLSTYPRPILDYRTARQHRVQQLERQRQPFLRQQNVVPFLARLPRSLVPFGVEQYGSEVQWVNQTDQALFPEPLNLDELDEGQAQALRTWFVAHVDIKPRSAKSRSAKSKSSRRRRRGADPSDHVQLSLW